MIAYKIGNMFENLPAGRIFLAHGCNAQGVMGSGVAKELRDRYPWAYNTYRRVYEERGLELGEVITAVSKDKNTVIFNCITQKYYGRDGCRYANYGAIESCMCDINIKMRDAPSLYPKVVRMPFIGCSLGGADWNIVSEIINRTATNYAPNIYDFEGI